MTDRPILFSGAMVRALLAGTKTQTRRVLQGLGDQPIVEYDGMYMWKQGYRWGAVPDPKFPPGVRFAVGDRLYVREAWRAGMAKDPGPARDIVPGSFVAYEADGPHDCAAVHGRLRQGMHMPRWVSRLTLIVADVRVQRLQDINEIDAIAEGIDRQVIPSYGSSWKDYSGEGRPIHDARESYRTLWDSLNADRAGGAFAWKADPWVVAATFNVIHQNIDQVPHG